MKIFISWSGERSQKVAIVLQEWIMQIIQATDAWISLDIEKGSRWNQEINHELSESKVAILCLVKENLESNWLHFEAGAVAKTEDAMVITLLLDVKSTDLKQPLSQFQNTIFKKDDMFKLMQDINTRVEKNGGKSLAEGVLVKLFEKNWDELNTRVSTILASEEGETQVERTEKELMEEILQEVRDLKKGDQPLFNQYVRVGGSFLNEKPNYYSTLPVGTVLGDNPHNLWFKFVSEPKLIQGPKQNEEVIPNKGKKKKKK